MSSSVNGFSKSYFVSKLAMLAKFYMLFKSRSSKTFSTSVASSKLSTSRSLKTVSTSNSCSAGFCQRLNLFILSLPRLKLSALLKQLGAIADSGARPPIYSGSKPNLSERVTCTDCTTPADTKPRAAVKYFIRFNDFSLFFVEKGFKVMTVTPSFKQVCYSYKNNDHSLFKNIIGSCVLIRQYFS